MENTINEMNNILKKYQEDNRIKDIEISKLKLDNLQINERVKQQEQERCINHTTHIEQLQKQLNEVVKEKNDLKIELNNEKKMYDCHIQRKNNEIKTLEDKITNQKNRLNQLESNNYMNNNSYYEKKDTYSSNRSSVKKEDRCSICDRENEKSRGISNSKYCGYHYGGSY